MIEELNAINKYADTLMQLIENWNKKSKGKEMKYRDKIKLEKTAEKVALLEYPNVKNIRNLYKNAKKNFN